MRRARKPGGEAVKAELYAALVRRGVAAAVEVRLPATSARSRGTHFRADVGVYAGPRLVAVAECKPYCGPLTGARQFENYLGCGVPFLTCGRGEVEAVADALTRLVTEAA